MPLKAENEHISIQASQCTVRLQNGDVHRGVKIDHWTLPRSAKTLPRWKAEGRGCRRAGGATARVGLEADSSNLLTHLLATHLPPTVSEKQGKLINSFPSFSPRLSHHTQSEGPSQGLALLFLWPSFYHSRHTELFVPRYSAGATQGLCIWASLLWTIFPLISRDWVSPSYPWHNCPLITEAVQNSTLPATTPDVHLYLTLLLLLH